MLVYEDNPGPLTPQLRTSIVDEPLTPYPHTTETALPGEWRTVTVFGVTAGVDLTEEREMAREQKMLKGHLPRVIFRQVC